ncbi:DUF998 domain-containing protein [Methanobacterium spitsbergense]|uniref:DUF998 domain-containing protein n=1 Tax=Methanobacterium spitsbergense TaxID=2874285 RepID=A0A8T5V272_9EURY|nr:DUF998 domain-containing protein [Methanobacterium spitsbergense]MBZ2165775.1 DUF998 domain-containing protein [Methanobacterium spitsbergense]
MKKIYPLFGIVGPILYIIAVFIGGAIRHDYSALYNAISELTMANAPNKILLDILFGFYNISLLIFGSGAYLDSRINSKKYNSATIMLVIIGILGLLVLVFTQDPRGTPATLYGTLHILLSGITAALTIISILLIGLSFKKYSKMKIFTWYSYTTSILILLSGGAGAISLASNNGFGGLFERITIFLFMIWVITLSYILYNNKIILDGVKIQ